MKISEICSDDTQRRHDIRAHRDQGKVDLNGIDYIEVSEDDQRVLQVHFMDRAPIIDKTSNDFTAANVRISGGRRIRNIRVIEVRVCQPEDEEQPDCMEVVVDRVGDFSTYTLCLVEVDEYGHSTNTSLNGFDPRYACIDFSFKANCPSDLDCKTEDTCPPEVLVEPEINYLAKDYASFRQLILDRLSLVMPDWQERHVPDFGITLVEILAYVGDYLSYYQDAVATEAYLDTARQRISVRRHTRLVDYPMHEGCNTRTWLFIETDSDVPDFPIQDVFFITGQNDALPVSSPMLTDKDLLAIPSTDYEVFEPLLLTKDAQATIQLYLARNEITFYTWSEKECCLPRGATTATLTDAWISPPSPSIRETSQQAEQPRDSSISSQPSSPKRETEQQQPKASSTVPEQPPEERARTLNLKVGDILIFEEVLGPKTGSPFDADPKHRHAVRLTKVDNTVVDPLYNVPVVEIEWGEEDKLPFPLCLSSIGSDCKLLEDISIARGNIILVDYGQTIKKDLDPVPIEQTIPTCECGEVGETETIAGLYRPHLKKAPLTFYEPLPLDAPLFSPVIPDPSEPVVITSASSLLRQDPRIAVPWIRLTGTPPDDGGKLYAKAQEEQQNDEDEDEDEREIESNDMPPPPLASKDIVWTVKRDLLESESEDYDFVVEMDNDGFAHLRFGDGELGRMPEAGTKFHATYRIGNGLRGNVGAESISHIVFPETKKFSGPILQPRNPFVVYGGTDPEPLPEIKLFAPHAFRTTLQRAITADDYAQLALRNPKVRKAAATLRWTGSWYEVLVAIARFGTEEADDVLLDKVEACLEHYRRIGYDLKVVAADYVPLDIAMTVRVQPHYLRGHVKAALLDVFSNRLLPNGRTGFFYPDNLAFGEGIALSKLVAAAQAVTGVQSVTVTKLERFQEGPNNELANEFLPIGPMEIAQLDNDPSFPEHGKLTFKMVGGR